MERSMGNTRQAYVNPVQQAVERAIGMYGASTSKQILNRHLSTP